MGNRDINLFKAAGGERAKGAKTSPMTYMVLVVLVIIVAAIGVLVLFNMKANKAESDLKAKEGILQNYENTIMNVQMEGADGSMSLSQEYKSVKDAIKAAAAITQYSDSTSALYPKALKEELDAVKDYILSYPIYSVNDPVMDEEEYFEPWDIEGFREMIRNEGANDFADRGLFYYALEKLAQEQADDPEVNHWYTYYRGYLLVVFTGGDGMGLDVMCEDMIVAGQQAMKGYAPFSKFEMFDDAFSSEFYAPVKHFSRVYETSDTEAITFNCLLLPMKSAIERAMDILEAHSRALLGDNENAWGGTADVEYGVDNILFTNTELSFSLILPKEVSMTGYMKEFESSPFFSVADSVARPGSEDLGAYTEYKITVEYKYVTKKTNEE